MAKRRGIGWVIGLGVGLFAAGYVQQTLKDKYGSRPFRKRTYSSVRELISAVRPFWRDPSLLRSMRENEQINPLFAERMMLVVTGVNGCRYCSFAHLRYAQSLGLDQGEIDALLGGRRGVSEKLVHEAQALYFASHYAETGGHPDTSLVEALLDTYGQRTAKDIVSYLCVITIANLVGNTFDALLSRIGGQPAPDSTLTDELATLGVFALGVMPLAPVAFVRGIVKS